MRFVDDAVELLKQLLLLLLNVLVLLMANLVLPLHVLVLLLSLEDLALLFSQHLPHFIVLYLLFLEPRNVFSHIFQRLHDHIVVRVLDHLFAIGRSFADFLVFEVGSQGGDHVHVEARDIVVVVMNVLVLLVVLRFQLFDGTILSRFDLGDFSFALGLHVLPQARHLSFVLLLDLIGNALILLTLCSRD